MYSKQDCLNLIKQHKPVVGFFGAGDLWSNFHHRPFVFHIQNTSFNVNNAEQAFMIAKAMTFDDKDVLKQLQNPRLKPNQYKRLGRQVKNYDDTLWQNKRFDVMLDVLRQKFDKKDFTTHKFTVFVEESPYDAVWGIRQNDYHKHWHGENLLGRALMQVRDEMLNQDKVV